MSTITLETLTESELAEIRARMDAATPGPWVKVNAFSSYPECDDKDLHFAIHDSQSNQIAFVEENYWVEDYEADSNFIAHARTDVPRLLAHIEALEAKLAEHAAR